MAPQPRLRPDLLDSLGLHGLPGYRLPIAPLRGGQGARQGLPGLGAGAQPSGGPYPVQLGGGPGFRPLRVAGGRAAEGLCGGRLRAHRPGDRRDLREAGHLRGRGVHQGAAGLSQRGLRQLPGLGGGGLRADSALPDGDSQIAEGSKG